MFFSSIFYLKKLLTKPVRMVVTLFGGGWSWVRWGKIKCGANCVGLCVGLQLFLFCEGLAFCLSFYFLISVVVSSFRVSANVLALGEKADFEALNCQPALHLIRRTNVQLTTEPPLSLSPC